MRCLTVVLVCALSLALTACATKPERRSVPVTNIPAEVGAEFQKAVAAWNAGDLNGFVSIYDEAATFVVPDGILTGRNAIRAFYMPLFEPGARRDELSFEQFNVEVLSPDTVLVRAIYRNTNQGRVTRRGATTLIMRRVWGEWRIVHDHSM
jgi:beta-aspartyl-peptidase (threonine type)